MKLYNFSATFEASNQKPKELDSDDLQECKAWLARQLAKNNAPGSMGIYDNQLDKPVFVEFNEPLDEE